MMASLWEDLSKLLAGSNRERFAEATWNVGEDSP